MTTVVALELVHHLAPLSTFALAPPCLARWNKRGQHTRNNALAHLRHSSPRSSGRCVSPAP
eukprot:CAMPEP_0185203060 /NCGR_PEP_ID=MMETSP1140-20130426/52274_1 /TAXON_ID=298111 /ORGANISM="Pavlova sp., Strain CCMP459" /LENGTH=60 /DNA_ID=CAMNT_0027770543 /DNA_START=93 /DNA_END=271 /DNA_ORIENTATION=-